MSASVMRVVLPVVGAVAGSFIPGLGWKWGLSIGEVAAGLLYPVTTPGPTKDLKIQSYTYGVAIPRVYGKNRLAGTVIWTNGKQAHSHNSGGKGGGGGQQYYSYTSSFAVLVCAGPINAITRIWADGTMIYDGRPGAAHVWASSVTGSNVRAYLGTSTQSVDPSIQSDKGAMTPAFRNRAYVVFQDYDLTNSGNNIPNMEFEVSSSASTVTLDTVIQDICQQASRVAGSPDTYSLKNSDFSLSALSSISVDGYAIPTRIAAKDAITNLQDVYRFDLVEIDGVIQAVMRAASAPILIPDGDLGARPYSESGPGSVDTARVEITRAQDVEMPRRLDFIYRSLGFDYQPGMQSAMRNVGYSSSLKTMAANIVLQDNTARAVADILLHEAWIKRNGYVVRLPYRWYQVAPGDVLSLPAVSGESRLMKVVQVVAGLPGQLVVTGTAYDPDVYSQSVNGAGLTSGGVGIVVAGGTVFMLADLPALRPADSAAPGFYAGACSDGTGVWRGASLYMDAGGGYAPIAHFNQAATIGLTNSGLPTGVTSGFDRSSSVVVQLDSGTLSSASESALLNDPTRNACAIGGEVLQFASAVLTTSPNIWTLSDFLRGLKGTSTTGHTSGENFILLNNAVIRVNLDPSQIGIAFNYKGVTDGVDPTTITSFISFTVVGNSLLKLPAAPTGLAAAAGNASVALTWSSTTYASSYNVLRATTSGGPYLHVATTTAPNYTDTGLTNGTTYYYVVQAANSLGQSPYSAQVTATPSSTRVVPAYPSGLHNEWRASTGFYSDGGSTLCTDGANVYQANDQAGVVQMGQTTPANQPVWHASVLPAANPGLAAAATFDGTDDVLNCSAISLGTNCAAVFTFVYEGDGGVISGAAADYAIYLVSGAIRTSIGGTAATSSAHGMTVGNVYTVGVRIEAGTAYWYQGQTALGSGAVGAGGYSPTAIGALSGGTLPSNFKLVAGAYFNVALGDSGIKTAISHQEAQYGSP